MFVSETCAHAYTRTSFDISWSSFIHFGLFMYKDHILLDL